MGIDSRPITIPAAADLTASFRRFGKMSATGLTVCTVAGERADAVIGAHFTKVPVLGDAVDSYVERVFEVTAGGVVARGDAITTDSVGRAVIAGAGQAINGVALTAGTIGSVIDAFTPLSRAVSSALVADTALSIGQEGIYVFAIPDAATADYDKILTEKVEVVDAWVVKSGAGAANTVQLKHAAVAVSDVMAAAVDKATTRAATLDPAQVLFAAGDIMRVTATKAAGTMLAKVFVRAIRRA